MYSGILQSYLVSTIDTFTKLGFDANELLSRTDLQYADVSQGYDSSTLIDYAKLLTVYQNALAMSDAANIGLQFGEQASIGIYGVVGYAMLSATTDIDAVELALKYQQLILGEPARISLDVAGDYGVLRLAVNFEDRRLARFYVEQLLASCIEFNKTLAGQPSRIHELCLAYPDPGYAAEYQRLFNCKVSFDCLHNEMRFDPGILDIKLPNTNTTTTRACADICDDLLGKSVRQSSVSHRLAQLLRENFAHFSDMRAAARYFNCDERTLRRKLTLENTSFRATRDDVGLQLATELLNKQKSVKVVAESLGYASSRTFSKAFSSWTGTPPAEYRRCQR